jgi:hypothetical protein
MGAGRPTIFTPELGAEICFRMMTKPLPDNSITKICAADDMPCRTTVYYWLLDAAKEDASEDLKEFLNRYNIACNIRLDNMFEEAFIVAYNEEDDLIVDENGTKGNSTKVSRDKVKIDMIKWALSKMNPEKYGERIKQEITGELTLNPADQLINALNGE